MRTIGSEQCWDLQRVAQASEQVSGTKRTVKKNARERSAAFEKEVVGVDAFMSVYLQNIEEEDTKTALIFKNLFENFDADHDGLLDLSEFASLLNSAVHSITSTDKTQLPMLTNDGGEVRLRTTSSMHPNALHNTGDREQNEWEYNGATVLSKGKVRNHLSDQDIVKLYNEITLEAPEVGMTGDFFATIARGKLYSILGFGNGVGQNGGEGVGVLLANEGVPPVSRVDDPELDFGAQDGFKGGHAPSLLPDL